MNIIFIVDTFPSISETFVLNQITGLMDQGHDVKILAGCRPTDRDFHKDIQSYCLLKNTFYFNDKPSNKFVRVMEAFVLILLNLHNNPLAIFNSLNIFKYGKEALSLNYLYKVMLFLGMGKIDIILCHFGPNGNIGALMREMGIQAKVLTMFHGYDIRRGIHDGGKIYKKLFKYNDKILSICRYNYKHLLDFGAHPQKIVTHPVGINVNKFPYEAKNRKQNSKKIVISVARHVSEKGLNYGIDAIKVLVDQYGHKHIKYQIIGEGPLTLDLQTKVSDLKLKDHVEFIGAQQQAGVASLLQRADIYLLPSVAEALPVVLMEAQAAGLPVVASNVGSVDEIVLDGKTGYIVEPKDVSQIALKLDYLLKNEKTWQEMGRSGHAHIEEKYNISTLNKRLESLFQELLLEN